MLDLNFKQNLKKLNERNGERNLSAQKVGIMGNYVHGIFLAFNLHSCCYQPVSLRRFCSA
jgi:hypothetical protein